MELKLVRVRGQRSVKSRQRRNQNCNRVGRGGGQDIRGRGRVIQGLGRRSALTTPTPPIPPASPPELLLPPDLAGVSQEVDEGLQQPDAEAAATAAVGAGRGGRGSGAQLRPPSLVRHDGVLGADDRPAGTAVLGADGGGPGPCGIRIVVDEPAKAEQLHDKRGQEHKQHVRPK